MHDKKEQQRLKFGFLTRLIKLTTPQKTNKPKKDHTKSQQWECERGQY